MKCAWMAVVGKWGKGSPQELTPGGTCLGLLQPPGVCVLRLDAVGLWGGVNGPGGLLSCPHPQLCVCAYLPISGEGVHGSCTWFS